MIDIIHDDADKLLTDEEKMERFTFHYKALKRLEVKEGLKLIPGNNSVKDEITGHLERVLYKLENKLRQKAEQCKEQKVKVGDKEIDISFGLSVDELSKFVAAQKEMGMIRNATLTELAEFMHSNYHTIEKRNPSVDSFYNAFSKKRYQSAGKIV